MSPKSIRRRMRARIRNHSLYQPSTRDSSNLSFVCYFRFSCDYRFGPIFSPVDLSFITKKWQSYYILTSHCSLLPWKNILCLLVPSIFFRCCWQFIFISFRRFFFHDGAGCGFLTAITHYYYYYCCNVCKSDFILFLNSVVCNKIVGNAFVYLFIILIAFTIEYIKIVL